MRKCLVRLAIVFAILPFHATVAPAEERSSSFSFVMAQSSQAGCVEISYIFTSHGFPNLENGTVTVVRFFHSDIDADSTTENSPFEETSVTTDEQDRVTVTPKKFCGFTPGTYNFKYGLYDTNNQLLEFMPPEDFDPYSHAVSVPAAEPYLNRFTISLK